MKKSNASQDQPRKPTQKNIHCWKSSRARSLNGLSTLFIGGLSVGIRVAIYLPTLIFSSFGLSYRGDSSRESRSFSLKWSDMMAASLVSQGTKKDKKEGMGYKPAAVIHPTSQICGVMPRAHDRTRYPIAVQPHYGMILSNLEDFRLENMKLQGWLSIAIRLLIVEKDIQYTYKRFRRLRLLHKQCLYAAAVSWLVPPVA